MKGLAHGVIGRRVTYQDFVPGYDAVGNNITILNLMEVEGVERVKDKEVYGKANMLLWDLAQHMVRQRHQDQAPQIRNQGHQK